ncbi:MAG: SPFH/Band 7/PHB domain protein, partial [Chloroflexota bacterium]|nr:SPFH/Band 7/PHB domain protein [Chloroflexota bacterium]
AFAQAAVIRPKMIGEALREISGDPDVAGTLFEILETQKMLENKGKLTLLVEGGQRPLLADLLASRETGAVS